MTYLNKLQRARRLIDEAAAELTEAYSLALRHQAESVYHLAKKLSAIANDDSGNVLSIFLLINDLTFGSTKEEK